MSEQPKFKALELCAGAGGQAIGLESAGFECAGAVEIDAAACKTLRENRPGWEVHEIDLHDFNPPSAGTIDLVAAGVPCPPFSIAGKQLGASDERDLFPKATQIVEACLPKAVMFENVRGFSAPKFASYRARLEQRLRSKGYLVDSRVLNASDFGVPQLRPRFILVALQPQYAECFLWPHPSSRKRTVAQAIGKMLGSEGWPGIKKWSESANRIAPTIVGGSKKHGGPDLGPTRARLEWAKLGVDGLGIADAPPNEKTPTSSRPKLTVEMVAAIQGFPAAWRFVGGKTARYRQVGNAFPPPVAKAVGESIRLALERKRPGLRSPSQLPAFASSLLAPTA